MRKIRLYTALLLIAAQAHAEPLATQMEGRTVLLAPPEGACAYREDDEKDADVFSEFDRMSAGKSRLLLAFADCGDMEAMHAGRPQTSGDYGSVVFVSAALKKDEARAAFVERMTQSLTARHGLLEKDPLKLADRLLDSTFQINQVQILGVLKSAPDLVQMASLENVQLAGRTERVLGVITDTMLAVPVRITLYHIASGTEDAALIQALGRRAETYARALIDLQNDGGKFAHRGLIAVILAVWLTLVAAGLAFVRRRPKTTA